MKEIDNTSIDDELNLIKGESSSAVCVRLYPYNNLDDREFEVLVWRLFTEDICSFYEEDGVEVKLMEGVCDKGRDVTFKKMENIYVSFNVKIIKIDIHSQIF